MLASASHLSQLRLNECNLPAIPRGILFLDSLSGLYLHGASIPELPGDLLSQEPWESCLTAVRDHVLDLEAGAEPLRDCKLIVLGNGRVGKTQICRRLAGLPFDETVPSTHGITVDTIAFGDPAVGPVLNVWDFGGQDIYHGTHALFARTRAVFLIVWNPKSEATDEYEHDGLTFRNNRLPYWLEYVRHLGGAGSAVIVVQSQCDRPQQEEPVLPVSRELLEFSFRRVLSFSAKNDRGRGTLDDAITEAIAHLRARDGIATIGKGRAEVVRRLRRWLAEDLVRPAEERLHRTISRRDFGALCSEVGGIHSPESLLKYLHDAGVVFHRGDEFGDEIVLDQSWALDAVYSLFDRSGIYRNLIDLKGRFTRSLLGRLAWTHYTEAQQRLFIHLMLACGICFEVRRADDRKEIEAEYAAPDLLPNREEAESALRERRWRSESTGIQVAFPFAFLHRGVIRGLISSIGSEAVDAGVYWKSGVWVNDARTEAAAVVEEQRKDDIGGEIVLTVQGDGRETLARRLAHWIVRRPNWRGGAPSVRKDGVALDEANARTFLELDVEWRPRDWAGARSRKPVGEGSRDEQTSDALAGQPAASPFDFTRPTARPSTAPRVFVSYAWGDATPEGQARERIVDELCVALGKNGIEVIRDKTHTVLGSRISDFIREISEGDRIITVISAKYLRSTYCMSELFQIYRRSGDDDRRFDERVIPLILPDAAIDTLPQRLKHAIHWKTQLAEVDPLIQDLGVRNIGPQVLADYQRMAEFAHKTAEILTLVSDRLIPRDFERMTAAGFREILELVTRETSKPG